MRLSTTPLDAALSLARRGERDLHLTPSEFRLLWLLTEDVGTLVATDRLLERSDSPLSGAFWTALAEAWPSDLARLQPLFPDMPPQMLADLARLAAGNLEHVAEVRHTDRQLDIEHREWMICVGRGFDFLHAPNLALIIGPYSPDLADPIRKAGGIIAANMASGRIPDDGFLLLASSPYEEIGADRARAELKARFLARFAADVIRRELPDLAPRMTVRTGVLNWATRALEGVGEP